MRKAAECGRGGVAGICAGGLGAGVVLILLVWLGVTLPSTRAGVPDQGAIHPLGRVFDDGIHSSAAGFDPGLMTSPAAPANGTAAALFNLSTRARVREGAAILIGGFVIRGDGPKRVLIRARGPSLTAAGVAGAMPDPKLRLLSGATELGANDDWKDGGQQAAIAATGRAPQYDAEAALLATLEPGAYTVQIQDARGASGVAIFEVIGLDEELTSRLFNISTRASVETGTDVTIGGFVIRGTSPKQVLIRARGPSMVGVPADDVLADPTLELFAGATRSAENDNWGTGPDAAAIAATGRAPVHAAESAILTTLDPGAYTTILRGVNATTGIGIVEVIAVDDPGERPDIYGLTVSKIGNGSGTVASAGGALDCGGTCNAEFPAGAAVTLSATAAIGSVFVGWGGDCAGPKPSCSIEMTSARNVVAQFETSSPERNQALGPLSGATVSAYRLGDLVTPVEGPLTAHQSLTDLTLAGTFDLALPGIPDQEWILVAASGGLEIDAHDDGIVDSSPTTNHGTLHAIGRASDWRAGRLRINVLTEIAWQQIAQEIGNGSFSRLSSDLRWIANALLTQAIDGSGLPTDQDLARYRPSNPNDRAKLVTNPDYLMPLAAAIRAADTAAFQNITRQLFGDGVQPLRAPELRTLSPKIDVPDNRNGISALDLTVRSMLSAQPEIEDTPEGGLLLAEDSHGNTVLLAWAMPGAAASSLRGSRTPRALASQAAILTSADAPELSSRSTVLALVLMIAGNGLDADGKAFVADAAVEHAQFEMLVAEFEVLFAADPLVLESLAYHSDFVGSLKSLAKYLSRAYLEAIDPEAGSALALNNGMPPLLRATETNKTFCVVWPDSLCASPWRPGQPWDWFGSADLLDVWNPPFPAVRSNEKRVLAIGNPGMLNHAMAVYDSRGNLLPHPHDWRMVPRNSTLIQKGLNSGANIRENLGLPDTASYLEFTKHRFAFFSDEPGAPIVSTLNALHLASSAIGLASSVMSQHAKGVLDSAADSVGGLDLFNGCVESLINTLEYFPTNVDDDSDDAAAYAVLDWLRYNTSSFVETALTQCVIPISIAFGADAATQYFLEHASLAVVELYARISNPVGWAIVVMSAANDFAPFALSYVGFSNNYAGYQLGRDGGGSITAIRTDRRPQYDGGSALPPIADFTYRKDVGRTISLMSTSALDAKSSPSFTWDFGDGTSALGLEVTHTYGAPGLYSVTLTVEDQYGKDRVPKTVEITTGSPPVIHSVICNLQPNNASRLQVNADVSDPDGDLTLLEWYLTVNDENYATYTDPALYLDGAVLQYPFEIDAMGVAPKVVAVDQAGNRTTAVCVVGRFSNGLIGYWPFNGSALDESGNRNHGAVHGANLTSDRFGRLNRAYAFNGVSDYISIPNSPVFNLGVDYAFSVWINQTTQKKGGFRIVNKSTAGSCDGWNLDTYDDSIARTGKRIRWNVGCPWRTSSGIHALDRWNNIVVSVKKNMATFYLNGEANGSGSVPALPVNSLNVLIGGGHGAASAHYFHGKIDDLRIYNRALTDEEIQALFSAAQ